MKILVIADYYLPGYKGGGPIRTLANMVQRLGDDFDFYILTRDRDLGDSTPYPDVQTGAWVQVGKAQVRYLPPQALHMTEFAHLLHGTDHDLIYLNSFFSSWSVETLFLRWQGRTPRKPLILAPRGEFYAGALAIKSAKKRVYLAAVQLLGLGTNILWQASTEDEAATITRIFPKARIHVARDLIAFSNHPGAQHAAPLPRNVLKIVFISRISPKKNLKGALQILSRVKGPAQFDIYGPQEDPDYWAECAALIEALPAHIQAAYKGTLHPEAILATFAHYHLFLFPTYGENFGHVIWEALYAGCMVLTSDQTPWLELETRGAGWALPLVPIEAYAEKIQQVMAISDWETRRKAARQYAEDVANQPEVLEANRHLFLNALER